MYYELYIDVFFLENFMLDSLLLFLVHRVLKSERAYGRMLLGGALGSLMTCLIIAAPLPSAVRLFLSHAVVNSIMLMAGLKIKGREQFAKAFILLYLSAVAAGGVMQIFRPYMRYVSLFYAAAAVSGYLFLKMWRFISYLQRRRDTVLKVTIYTDSGEQQVCALIDTGNSLRDHITGDPVSIIDPGCISSLSGRPEEERGFRLIPYKCVGGESMMRVFRARKMCVHMEEDRWIEEPLLGIGEKSLSGDGEYEMILNPAVLSG